MTDSISEHAARRIEGSPAVVSCRLLASGYANANYRLETESGVFLLRDRLDHDLGAVEFELDVLDWLRLHDFPAPAAIRFENGDRWIPGPNGGHLVLLSWLEGAEPVPDFSSVVAVGHAIAKLHRLPPPDGDWWHRENPIGLEAADRLAGKIPIDPRVSELIRFFVEEFAVLRDQIPEGLPSGLIHGDIFTDNTLFQDGELVAILDFDAACEDVFLFDVAMTIHGFCYPKEQWNPQLAEVFLKAYEDVRPLTRPERDALPIYLWWCPLAMMGWHLGQLLRRPNETNETRARQLARRVDAMKKEPWELPA